MSITNEDLNYLGSCVTDAESAKELGQAHKEFFKDYNLQNSVEWNDPKLISIDRVRLLTDKGAPLWDVSYCVGTTTDGKKLSVLLPFGQLWKPCNKELFKYANKDGVNLIKLGWFKAVSYFSG